MDHRFIARRLLQLAVVCAYSVAPAIAAGQATYNCNALYPISSGDTVFVSTPTGVSAGTTGGNAAIWSSSGVVTQLNPALLPSTVTLSEGASTDGTYVVGDGRNGQAGNPQALVWNTVTNGVNSLAPSGSNSSIALGVAAGQVVGWARYTSPTNGQNENHGMLWTQTGSVWTTTDLTPSSIPGAHFSPIQAQVLATDGSRQVGWADVFAALWTGTASSFENLGPTNLSFASSEAVQLSGSQIVGIGFLASGANHPLLWTGVNTTPTDLLPSGVNSAWVNYTNGSQQVGYAVNNQTGTPYAMVWSGTADSAIDLSQFLPNGFDIAGESSAHIIDASGNIFGTAETDSGGYDVVEWSPAPEPSSAAICSIGLALLARRRKK